MTPEEPQNPPAPPDPLQVPKAVDELLATPELAKAVEIDECRLVLDHVPIAIVVSRLSDDEQKIVYANPVFEILSGLTLAEVDGKPWSILDHFRHEDDADLGLGQAILAGEDFLGTFRRDGADGEHVLAQAYASRIENEDDSEDFRIAALVDVTAHERAQRDAFEIRIREKDLLLKELQHRVKNNLQLITALIRLEARTAQRGGDIDLDRLAGRIETLALLYQTLATDAFGNQVDLAPYLSTIVSAAVRTQAPEDIELDLKVGYCPVSVNVAMPVGLLVNELITNAFKHAFVGRDGGRIQLECHRLADDRFEVVVADDGIGFPRGETWPRGGKLGALILQTLRENTRQTEFRIDSAPGKGTRARIVFVHPAPKAH